jgi:hypothetical protein
VTDDPGYLVAVADGLLFALGGEWARLTAYDADVRRDTVQQALRALADLGASPSFGDGELPAVPAEGAIHVAVLHEQLRRIREIAPHVLASGADTFARILCTDPWPRIYTTAALDLPPSSPVHVLWASDLSARPDQWARAGELARFHEARSLVMFGAPLDRAPWPLDLAALPELRALDVSRSRLRALPPSLAGVAKLEALELAGNPIDAASLDVLGALPALRYVGLRGAAVPASALSALRARLPSGCELAP